MQTVYRLFPFPARWKVLATEEDVTVLAFLSDMKGDAVAVIVQKDGRMTTVMVDELTVDDPLLVPWDGS